MTDTKPKTWSRTCEAAKWLSKDLYEGEIDPHRDQTHVVQENCPLYLYNTKTIFQQNFKKTIKAFISVSEISDEALLQWVEDGKPPNSYKTGKSYVILLLYVQIRCKVTFYIFIFKFFTKDKKMRGKIAPFSHSQSTKESLKKSVIKGGGVACSELQLLFILSNFVDHKQRKQLSIKIMLLSGASSDGVCVQVSLDSMLL